MGIFLRTSSAGKGPGALLLAEVLGSGRDLVSVLGVWHEICGNRTYDTKRKCEDLTGRDGCSTNRNGMYHIFYTHT